MQQETKVICITHFPLARAHFASTPRNVFGFRERILHSLHQADEMSARKKVTGMINRQETSSKGPWVTCGAKCVSSIPDADYIVVTYTPNCHPVRKRHETHHEASSGYNAMNICVKFNASVNKGDSGYWVSSFVIWFFSLLINGSFCFLSQTPQQAHELLPRK